MDGKGPSIEATRLKESLMRLPITFGMALKTRDQCKEIAKRLEHKEHCFVLGKGTFLYPGPSVFVACDLAQKDLFLQGTLNQWHTRGH